MEIKAGVRLQGLRPELLMGIMVAQSVYQELGVPFVITSVVDSRHSVTSLHYAGCAVDLRTRDMTAEQAGKAVQLISARLTADFDCLLESNHIHLEYQPRQLT